MTKKRLIIVFVIFILVLFGIYLFSFNKFDMNVSPANYNLDTMKKKYRYVEYVKKYIEPKKLANFLNPEHIDFIYVEKYNTGLDSLIWFRYEAYTELFYQMFNKSRKGYDDCPITEKFLTKFGNNLFEYFNLINADDSSIDCGISEKDKTLRVTEAGDFNLGEPSYIYHHHFHYILDDEGNVDDIIFDYTE